MSESERAAAVREAYAAYSRGDYDTVLELLDPAVEWHPPPATLEPQVLRGRDAVREYMTPNLFAEQGAEPLEVVEEGDRILVIARVTARGAGSGVEIEQTSFHLWTVSDERVVCFEAYSDREQAMAALREEVA